MTDDGTSLNGDVLATGADGKPSTSPFARAVTDGRSAVAPAMPEKWIWITLGLGAVASHGGRALSCDVSRTTSRSGDDNRLPDRQFTLGGADDAATPTAGTQAGPHRSVRGSDGLLLSLWRRPDHPARLLRVRRPESGGQCRLHDDEPRPAPVSDRLCLESASAASCKFRYATESWWPELWTKV